MNVPDRIDAGANCSATMFSVPVVAVPRQAPAREGMADLGPVRLWHWDTGGDGEAVVLMHPVVGSGAMWLYQQPVLAAAGYRVIGYSRRGHYRSEAGPAHDPGTAAGDLRALLDYLGLERVHLIGSAAGGFAAADFAITFPERLNSLTLATSLVAVQDASYMAATAPLRPHAFESLPREFREVGPAYRAENPEGLALWLAMTGEAVATQVKQTFASALDLAALARLNMPVLVLASDADMYAPPPVMKRLADVIPGARVALVRGAGHSAYWEQPQAFNDAVLGFLDSVCTSQPRYQIAGG